MPSFAAALIASIASWMADAVVEPFLGIGGRIFVSLVVSIAVYVYARRWLVGLRDGL
jgi:hypothetical protein